MIHACDWVLQITDTLRVQETAFQDVEISKFLGGGPLPHLPRHEALQPGAVWGTCLPARNYNFSTSERT